MYDTHTRDVRCSFEFTYARPGGLVVCTIESTQCNLHGRPASPASGPDRVPAYVLPTTRRVPSTGRPHLDDCHVPLPGHVVVDTFSIMVRHKQDENERRDELSFQVRSVYRVCEPHSRHAGPAGHDGRRPVRCVALFAEREGWRHAIDANSTCCGQRSYVRTQLLGLLIDRSAPSQSQPALRCKMRASPCLFFSRLYYLSLELLPYMVGFINKHSKL